WDSQNRLACFLADQCNGDPACDFARIIASHPVSQQRQPDTGIGADAVLVVRTYHAGVGRRRHFDRFAEVHSPWRRYKLTSTAVSTAAHCRIAFAISSPVR